MGKKRSEKARASQQSIEVHKNDTLYKQCPSQSVFLASYIQRFALTLQNAHEYNYRIALIFRGPKFSRIAVSLNFVEIILRMRASQHATPTITEFPVGAYTWQTR